MSEKADNIKLVLVDDHPAVLCQTIQLLPDRFEVLETLNDTPELLNVVQKLHPDIIVLDITLPTMSGVDAARRLRLAGDKTTIVFLSVHTDPDYAWEAFNVGALGYVIKRRLASDLVRALDAALAGKRFVSPCPELNEFTCS
jgi:DNA-binding NarL/FixJ family response regulator